MTISFPWSTSCQFDLPCWVGGPARWWGRCQQSSGTLWRGADAEGPAVLRDRARRNCCLLGGNRSVFKHRRGVHGWWWPQLHRIIHQMNNIVAAEDEWAGNLKAKGTLTDFKLKIDTRSHVLSEMAFVVLKRESCAVEGEQVKLLAFWGSAEGIQTKGGRGK